MKRLKPEIYLEQESINLYRLSQPSLKESMFKVNHNRKVIANLDLNNHRNPGATNHAET